MILRSYQADAVERVERAFANGTRRVMLTMPTGAGKTVCFSHLARAWPGRTLILVHRQELLRQASRALTRFEVPHSIIAPGYERGDEPVQVASIQTLGQRLKTDRLQFDHLIVDEAHHAAAGTWSKVLGFYDQARILGVSATPVRLDGRGLGDFFDAIVTGPQVRDLTEAGHLVPARVFTWPTGVDLSAIDWHGGDYNRVKLAKAVDQARLRGDAIAHYRAIADGKRAIVFCINRRHAEHVAADFERAGYPFEVIHGGLTDFQRESVLAQFERGQIRGLVSVDIVSEGTDIPAAEVAILMRPTQSVALHLQQIGRVLRPAAGKREAIVLDHVGNVLEHGLPDEPRQWSLTKTGVRGSADRLAIRRCKSCFAAFVAVGPCPYCGAAPPKSDAEIVQSDGTTLGEVTSVDVIDWKRKKREAYQRAASYQECLQLTKKFGDKPGYAWVYWQKRQRARGGKF